MAASAGDLKGIISLGDGHLATHQVIRELALRVLFEKIERQDIFEKEEHLIAYLMVRLAWEKKEHIRAFFIDDKRRLIEDVLLADGSSL